MDKLRDKAVIIKENIEATISNAIETEMVINSIPNSKKKRELQAKNERRAQAIPSMIREMKEEEAKKELNLE